MTTPEKLSDAIAETWADIDDLIEAKSAEMRSRISALLEKPSTRDLAAWKAWEIPESLWSVTIDAIEAAATGHDDVWRQSIAGLRAACNKQAFVEIVAMPMIKLYSQRREEISGIARSIDTDVLTSHAKIGTPSAAFSAAKNRRKNGQTVNQ
jgi:hypothetical protein